MIFAGLCWTCHPSFETGSEKSEDKQQAVSYPLQFFFPMCDIKVIREFSAIKWILTIFVKVSLTNILHLQCFCHGNTWRYELVLFMTFHQCPCKIDFTGFDVTRMVDMRFP